MNHLLDEGEGQLVILLSRSRSVAVEQRRAKVQSGRLTQTDTHPAHFERDVALERDTEDFTRKQNENKSKTESETEQSPARVKKRRGRSSQWRTGSATE